MAQSNMDFYMSKSLTSTLLKTIGAWFGAFTILGIFALFLLAGSRGSVELGGLLLVGLPILGLFIGLINFVILLVVNYVKQLNKTKQHEEIT